MRRFFPVLLSLSLLFSGCAGGTEENAPVPEEAGPPEATEPLPPEESPVPSPENSQEPEGADHLPVAAVEAVDPIVEPADSDFVRVTDYIPTIQVDLAYAGTDNFTGQAIYGFTDAYLRYGTVQKLAAVQAELESYGLGLLIWDAFRPTAAQFKLWEVCPDPVYVADPERGFSSHSRGNTVDVTLISLTGEDVEMPTGFDDFSPLADRDYSDVPPIPAANTQLLEDAMAAGGFVPYSGEWWHFSDSEAYDVDTAFSP